MGFRGNGLLSQNSFAMDFVRIYTAVFLEVGLLKLNSANFAPEKLISMSSLTLENSRVQMTKFIIFNSLKGSGNSTFELTNFYIRAAELYGAQIGSFQAGNYLKIDNLVVENTVKPVYSEHSRDRNFFPLYEGFHQQR